jgi:class 3 adenylate cyclase
MRRSDGSPGASPESRARPALDTLPERSGRRDTWLAALTAAAIAWFAAAAVPALRLADNWITDLGRIALAPAPGPPSQIVLVTITEDTLATLPYRSPVNRVLLAEIVDKAAAAGARGLGLDILFDQPTEPAADRRLSDALRAAARTMPLVVAAAGQKDDLTKRQEKFLAAFTEGLVRGLVNLPADDDDGVVRWQQLGRAAPDGRVVPGFAAALAGLLAPASPRARAGIAPLAFSRGQPRRPADFAAFPAHAFKFVPNDWLTGKIVLVGADLPHSDRHRTPFAAFDSRAGMMPGIAIHAHGLNQALAGIELAEAPPWAGAPLAFAGATVTAFAFGLRFALAARVLMAGGIALGYAAMATWLLARWGAIFPVVAPALGILLAAAIEGGREWLRDRRQRAFIQEAFSRYLSPALVKLLVQEPGRLRLGGEERDITYVFTDLAGFTGLTEKIEPAIFVATLNDYLDNMCRIALDHEATIDKIVGDAVVAFFNAPIAQPDHAERGIRLALADDHIAEDFRTLMRARGLDLGVTRVGVNTGQATVGNFGGNRFFNYTGHGDSVNTAARLESVNKYLGTRICVGGATVSRCPSVTFRPVGHLVLKGKKQPIEVFEPLAGDMAGYAPRADYQAAYDAMAAKDAGARQVFAALGARYPDDPLVAFHRRRLGEGDSGAVIVMTEK